MSTVHPLAPTTASPSGLSAGCAGTWGRGGKGLAEGLSGPGQEGCGLQEHGLGALAEARLCSVFGQLCSLPSQSSMGLGLPEQPGQVKFPRFPCGHFLSSREDQGVVAPGPPWSRLVVSTAAWAPLQAKAVISGGAVPSNPQEQSQFLLLTFQSRVGLWGPGPAKPGPGHISVLHLLLVAQTAVHTLHCFISNRHSQGLPSWH